MRQQRLGSGSSAEVVVGEHLITKRKYAIKIVELTKKEIAWRYDREMNFLKDIDHTNVVRLYEVCSRPNALYFVMELCTGGHLGQVLRSTQTGRLSENRARYAETIQLIVCILMMSMIMMVMLLPLLIMVTAMVIIITSLKFYCAYVSIH